MTTTMTRLDEAAPMHDVAAEQGLLGAMMQSQTAADEALAMVKPVDFYDPRHQQLAEVIAEHLHREPMEPAPLQARLLSKGLLDAVGGIGYLSDLRIDATTSSSASWYARRIAELAQRRRIEQSLVRAHQIARDPGLDTDAVAARVPTLVAEAAETADAAADGPELFSDDLDDLFAQLRSPDPNDGISTGLGALDDVIGKLKAGQLVTVAARPGMGKSVFAADLARRAAWHQAESVALFSLEMPRTDLQKRMLSAESDVPLSRLTHNNDGLNDADMAKLEAVRARTDGAFLSLCADGGLTVSAIRARAKRLQRTVGLGLIVVDYMQLLTPDHRIDNRAQEVAEISRSLKLMAVELGVPIVAAAQVNRLSESRSDKRPHLSDLRESGSIEQDSDIVILLHRESYYDEDQRPGEIDMIVAKNRNGETKTVIAAAQLHKSRIVDMGIPTP